MTDLQGMIRAVVTTELGGVAVSWVGNALAVSDGADFPRDGGQFTVEGDPVTVYTYTSVTEGLTEDDPDILTTVEPAPAGLPSGEEYRLTMWPVAVHSVAEVALPESLEDTVPAIIPHSLKPYLPDGLREPEDQEAVIIGQREMAWVVVDILEQPEVTMVDVAEAIDEAKSEALAAHGMASEATVAAQDAHNSAVDAQAAADAATSTAGAAQAAADAAAQAAADAAGLAGGKSEVLFQTWTPLPEHSKTTTLWIDTTAGLNTPKRWDAVNGWSVVTDKAATDAAAAAAAAQTAASNAGAAASAAQNTANDAAAAAAAAQTAAGDAQTMATNALTSSNGRNSRVTSTNTPIGATHPITGLPWVNGDTWWQWDNTIDRNVIGAWTRRNDAWAAEKISDKVLASLDVNKLVVSGSARIPQAVINKLVGDVAYFDAFVGKTFTGVTFTGTTLQTNSDPDMGVKLTDSAIRVGPANDAVFRANDGGEVWARTFVVSDSSSAPLIVLKKGTIGFSIGGAMLVGNSDGSAYFDGNWKFTTTDWAPVSLNSGFTGSIQYRRAGNIVFLRGSVTRSTAFTTSYVQVATGFSAIGGATTQTFPVVLSGPTAVVAVAGQLVINNAGTMSVRASSNAATAYFDGISYPLD